MKETRIYTISRETANIQKKSIEIPSSYKQLHIVMEIPEICRYMAFLIVRDATGNIRFQKLLGYGEQKLCIGSGPSDTTIGGVPGEIMPGEWQIIVGVFTEYVAQKLGEKRVEIKALLTDEPTEITEPMGNWCWLEEGKGLTLSSEKYNWNQVYRAGAGWFKGDFHTHTRLSDGKETVANAMKKADDSGLDFYVPTEHNLMHTGWRATSRCILPGIEVTTDKGHFNLFGITRLPSKLYEIVGHNGDSLVDGLVSQTMREAKKEQWLVSINHPFLTIWSWRYADTKLADIDCLEIINDPTYPDSPAANEATVRFFDVLWEDGHQITAVGGSDSHNLIDERYENAEYPSIAGDPGTYVYCEKLTPNNLVKSVKNGHTVVARFIKVIPAIQAGGKVYYPGECIDSADVEQISIHLDITGDAGFLDESGVPQVFLVKNMKHIPAVVKQTGDAGWAADVEFSFDREKWQWARMEVRGKDGMLLGVVNPIYFGRKVSVYTTFGEAAETCLEGAEYS